MHGKAFNGKAINYKAFNGKACKWAGLLLLASQLSSCYFINFFKGQTSKQENATSSPMATVLGQSLGARAGRINAEALANVYSVTSAIAPAPIRPDPDMYARRLLLQYRAEGSAIAREIGEIEGFRLLLGGASSDFQKPPQDDYDATSLLANLTVAERICTGLVAPSASSHEGWESILPDDPDNWESNIRFLAQRFIGKPSSQIADDTITQLKSILDSNSSTSSYTYSDYIAVCTALALDAEALLL